MSTTTEDNNNCSGISNTCANCGKEGSNVTNTCNKCKMVKYCNAACKKKHRHKHKKDCEEHLRLAAEHAAKLHDEALFKQPPPKDEDCPICFLRMPSLVKGSRYKSCCGKVICNGCFFANAIRDDNKHKQLCAFCRIPAPESDEEIVERIKKRVEIGDSIAMFHLGVNLCLGQHGLPQDYTKALKLYRQAAELGYARAYWNIASCYANGEGVEQDTKMAKQYYELAAMGGEVMARHNLAIMEEGAGNIHRAIKHYMIGAEAGTKRSLDAVQDLFVNGYATKAKYTKALRDYQMYLSEVKSAQRDEAAAYSDDFKFKYIA